MRTFTSLVACAVVVIAICGLSGCGSADEKPAAQKKPSAPEKSTHDDLAHAGEGHPSEGPHHGQLLELGQEEYHAEVVHDDKNSKVTVYILDSAAKKAVPIEQAEIVVNLTVDGKTAQYKLAAAPLEGESSGQSSRFEATDESLLQALDTEGVKGRFNLTINDKPYVANVEHHDHEDEHHK